MNTIKALIKRHPLLSYFALTFAITWGLFVLAVGPGGIPATREQFTTLPLLAILAVLVGPSVSGILLTGLDVCCVVCEVKRGPSEIFPSKGASDGPPRAYPTVVSLGRGYDHLVLPNR